MVKTFYLHIKLYLNPQLKAVVQKLESTPFKSAGLSIEAGSRRRSAGYQTTLHWLVLPGYQLKRNTLCLKSLKTCPRLQEIESKQLFLFQNVLGGTSLDPPSLEAQSVLAGVPAIYFIAIRQLL